MFWHKNIFRFQHIPKFYFSNNIQACAGSLYQIYATKKEMQNSENYNTDKKNALKDSSDDDDDDGDDVSDSFHDFFLH